MVCLFENSATECNSPGWTETGVSCWVGFLLNNFEKNPDFCSGGFCGVVWDVPLLSLAADVSCDSFCSLIGWGVVGVACVGVGVASVWLVDGVTAEETLTGADTERGTEVVLTKKCRMHFNE